MATRTISEIVTTSTAVPTSIPQAEAEERNSSLALFLVLLLLIGSFWTSYYLKVKRITAVHETIVGLFAGMFVGAALRIGPLEEVQKMLSFSNTIMLNVLLPPIILASGYDLRQVPISFVKSDCSSQY
jgi:sodium/hydrogen exchanger-like protein 6/7